MSNNPIILPDFVIANLYGNNLVVGSDVVAKERTKQNPVEKTVGPIVAEQVENIPVATAKPTNSIPSAQVISTVPPTATEKPADKIPAVQAVPVSPTAVTSKPTAINTPTETPKQWFLGNNGKQITVMVKEDAVPYINDKHLQFLSNVLSACKLNLGDIALVNYKNYPLGFEELRSKSNPKIVLVFDLSPKELKLPFTIPFYQVQDYAQCRFLFAPSLTKMEGDHAEAKAEKTKLWNSLKILFGL
ncbi:MAG: hypothetical protein CFE25_00925 [Chitinophagaceae bacterium BSSC1]|nr:MAG: hypothetical protein CFE25_00925 [Chitinophagaceae bacterium BSSC1]